MYTGNQWGFIISGHHFDPTLGPLSIGYFLEDTSPGLIHGGLEALLSAEILRHEDDPTACVSMCDFVQWLANDEGGVHVEMFRDTDLRQRFREAQGVVPEHTKWTMIAVSRDVYTGLEPTLFAASRALKLLWR
ncbi:MAG: hypothetical protein WBG36_02110 [Ornithinimicrobium sp.]